jgi:hypothetical protein
MKQRIKEERRQTGAAPSNSGVSAIIMWTAKTGRAVKLSALGDGRVENNVYVPRRATSNA